MTTTINTSNCHSPLSVEEVLNAIYGLRFGEDGALMDGKPIGSLGRSPEDALYEWFDQFSEYLSEVAGDGNFCHSIYWHEPVAVVSLNGDNLYAAGGVVVVW